MLLCYIYSVACSCFAYLAGYWIIPVPTASSLGCGPIYLHSLWFITRIWWYSLSISSFSSQAWKQSSLETAPQRLDRHQGYLHSLQKLPNSYLLSSWLPLASLPLLPPTPSLILSSCFLHFRVGVQSRRVSQTHLSFQVSLFCTAFVHWLHPPPPSLIT